MSNILNQDSFFEQAATLEVENRLLKQEVKHLRDLIKTYTDKMLENLKPNICQSSQQTPQQKEN